MGGYVKPPPSSIYTTIIYINYKYITPPKKILSGLASDGASIPSESVFLSNVTIIFFY